MKRIPGIDASVAVAAIFAIGAPIYLGVSAIRLNHRVRELETRPPAVAVVNAADSTVATLRQQLDAATRLNALLRDSLSRERLKSVKVITDSGRPPELIVSGHSYRLDQAQILVNDASDMTVNYQWTSFRSDSSAFRVTARVIGAIHGSNFEGFSMVVTASKP